MKKIIFIISILMFSFTASARCFTYVFLGVSDEKRHFHRAKWVEDRAKEMGCIIIKTHDLDMKSAHDVLENKLKKEKFNPSKDKLHISFVDHGSSTKLPYSENNFVKYNKAFSDLDSRLPKGTDVTFSGHICWPRFSETAITSNFKNIKSMCGGAATDKENLATGKVATTAWARNREYVPKGWSQWSESFKDNKYDSIGEYLGFSEPKRKNMMKEINLFNFHYSNLGKDIKNLVKGSSLTSGTFLKMKLADLNDDTYKKPLVSFFGGEDFLEYEELSKDPKEICIHCSTSSANANSFESILDLSKQIENIKNKSVQEEIDLLAKRNKLYGAYSRLYKNSSDFIKNNINSLNSKLSKFHERKKTIYKLWNSADKEDYTNLENIETLWQDLRNDMLSSLSEYTAHLRKINDVEMIVALKEKSPKDLREFESLMACERANALDKL